MSSGKTITLRSSDGKTFEVENLVALQSQMIKDMVENGRADNVIPLPVVPSTILSKVIDYCKKREATSGDESVRARISRWSYEADFFKVDHETLFDLILAANCLKIESLLELINKTVARDYPGGFSIPPKRSFDYPED